jgi:CHAD domain-containing protein
MAEKKEDFPLLKHLDALVEELRVLAPQAVKGKDADAVHDARVATRRLKAAIDLLKPVLTRRHRAPFSKINRLLRRRLSPIRDADVTLAHLAKLEKTRYEHPAAWLSDRLKESREKALAQAVADLPPARVLSRLGSWWGLREEITGAREAVDSLLAESVHLQLDAFAEQSAGLADAAKATDPHQLRIAGKSLRYTLEMAKANGMPLPLQVLAHFRRIQTALGLWHDYVVLTELLLRESDDEDLMYCDAALQQDVLSLAAAMLKRGQHQLAKVAEFWNRDGQALVEQIRQCFPLTTPATEAIPQPPPSEEMNTETQRTLG